MHNIRRSRRRRAVTSFNARSNYGATCCDRSLRKSPALVACNDENDIGVSYRNEAGRPPPNLPRVRGRDFQQYRFQCYRLLVLLCDEHRKTLQHLSLRSERSDREKAENVGCEITLVDFVTQ